MAIDARFAKWGLGLFIFGVFLTFLAFDTVRRALDTVPAAA
jgi:hypothetical protein